MIKPRQPADRVVNPQQKDTSRSPSKVLGALRKLTDERPTSEHYDSYIKEIGAVGNDRGMAVLMVTVVEDSLQVAIESRLSVGADEPEDLFGNNSPMGTFANKIQMVCATENPRQRIRETTSAARSRLTAALL